MKAVFLVVTLLVSSWSLYTATPRPDEGAEAEDKFLGPLEILRKYGYPAEEHTVVTEDGYKLKVHRIPYGRLCSAQESKGPVLLQHGMMASSIDFFIIGTARGLAYILADSCYDVWLPNSRGNRFSKAHKYLSVHSSEFWDFSWHEMGQYDTPAEIDYILKETRRDNLVYIGHSQGGTQFAVFGSLRPEYLRKIKGVVLLAPVFFMEHITSVINRILSPLEGVLGLATNILGVQHSSQYFELNRALTSEICGATGLVSPIICQTVFFGADGYDTGQLNGTLLPIILAHRPAGSSVKQVLHYGQLVNSGEFRPFDYGSSQNRKTYGSSRPPNYDLSPLKIVPISIIIGKYDKVSTTKDISTFVTKMGGMEDKHIIPLDMFGHSDLIYGIDVVPYVNDPIIYIIDQY